MNTRFLLLALATCFATSCSTPKTSADATSKILAYAASSPLANQRWGYHRYSDKIEAVAKKQPPIGYTKGMALAYADIYHRSKRGDSLLSPYFLAPVGTDSTKDGLLKFKDKFVAHGVDVKKGGLGNLRALYALLFELGVRESDGRPYLGLDDGRYKPNEPINADTTEAGLFQSSWNYAYMDAEAKNIFNHYRSLNDRAWLSVFEEGVPPPSRNSDRSVGDGSGREFQDLSKANPKFATEFAAHCVRKKSLRSYFFIYYGMMDISPEALRFFEGVEKIVDRHGGPKL